MQERIEAVERMLLEGLAKSKGALGFTSEDDQRIQEMRDAAVHAVVALRAIAKETGAPGLRVVPR